MNRKSALLQAAGVFGLVSVASATLLVASPSEGDGKKARLRVRPKALFHSAAVKIRHVVFSSDAPAALRLTPSLHAEGFPRLGVPGQSAKTPSAAAALHAAHPPAARLRFHGAPVVTRTAGVARPAATDRRLAPAPDRSAAAPAARWASYGSEPLAAAQLLPPTAAPAFDLGLQPTSFTPYDRYMGTVQRVITNLNEHTASMATACELMQQGRSFRYWMTDPYRAQAPAVTAARQSGDCKAKALWIYDRLGDPRAYYVIGKLHRGSSTSHAWVYWHNEGRWWILDPTARHQPLPADAASPSNYVPYLFLQPDGHIPASLDQSHGRPLQRRQQCFGHRRPCPPGRGAKLGAGILVSRGWVAGLPPAGRVVARGGEAARLGTPAITSRL